MGKKRKKRDEVDFEAIPEPSETASSSQKKKKKRKKQTPESYVSSDWHSSTPETPMKSLVEPTQLAATNFPPDVTVREVKKFFKSMPTSVQMGDGFNYYNKRIRECLVSFNSEAETQEALKMSRKNLRGNKIYVTHQGNSRVIYRVSGLNPDIDNPRERVREIFQSRGELINVFLPLDENQKPIGFCYIYMDKPGDTFDDPASIDGEEIYFNSCKLKPRFQSEIEGTPLGVQDPKTILKKELIPDTSKDTTVTGSSYISFRPSIISPPFDQEADECWSIALSRAYNASLGLIKSQRPLLTKDWLVEHVDSSRLDLMDALDSIKYAIPVMTPLVKSMVVHQRPRGGEPKAYEAFEDFIIELLERFPVLVCMECLPSFFDFDGKGMYSPRDVDLRNFEIFPKHCLLLTGRGVEDGKEYWELQESKGEDWGEDEGFIKIERHRCLIQSVVQLEPLP